MNKVILVLNPEKAALLVEMGFTPCGTRQMDTIAVCQFIATDDLLKALNDKSKFNRKDYVYDMKLTF